MIEGLRETRPVHVISVLIRSKLPYPGAHFWVASALAKESFVGKVGLFGFKFIGKVHASNALKAKCRNVI